MCFGVVFFLKYQLIILTNYEKHIYILTQNRIYLNINSMVTKSLEFSQNGDTMSRERKEINQEYPLSLLLLLFLLS